MSAYNFEDFEEFDDEEFDDGELDGGEFEDIDDEVAADGNRLVGARPRTVLEYVTTSIADNPDEVYVEMIEDRRGIVFELHVDPDDMGRIIGRRGRVANAIRTLVRSAARLDGTSATVDIVD